MQWYEIAILGLGLLQAALFLVKVRVKVRELDEDNAINNPFRIIIDPKCPYPAAVLAQEWYEAHQSKNLYKNIRFQVDKKYAGLKECLTHEIENQAVFEWYDLTMDELMKYRWEEAKRMKNKYKFFEDWTPKEIETTMILYKNQAQDWLHKNKRDVLDEFDKIKDELGGAS